MQDSKKILQICGDLRRNAWKSNFIKFFIRIYFFILIFISNNYNICVRGAFYDYRVSDNRPGQRQQDN